MKRLTARIKSNIPELMLFALVFLVFFALSCLTPLASDDFNYSFGIWDDERIASLGDIFVSLLPHRYYGNGRTVAHFFTYFFLMEGVNKLWFNFFNALNACLILTVVFRFTRRDNHFGNLLILSLWSMIIWNWLPTFGGTMLWLDGACNYAWGAGFILLFLSYYLELYLGMREKKPGIIGGIVFLIVAFCAGAYAEAGSLAALFTALCLLAAFYYREKRPDILAIAGFSVAFLGYLSMMTAHSTTAARSADLGISTLMNNLVFILKLSRERLFPLLCAYLAVFALSIGRVERKRLFASAVIFLAGLGALAAYVFAIYFATRHFFYPVIFISFALIILVSELYSSADMKDLVHAAAAVVFCFFVFNFSLGLIDIGSGHLNIREQEEKIYAAKAAGETEIYLESVSPSTEYSLGRILYKTEIENRALSLYYGIDILGLD